MSNPKKPAPLQVVPFDYESHTITTVEQNGIHYFVAADICDILGLGNVTRSLIKLDSDEKLTLKILRAGQLREVGVVTESGLYGLIMRSSKPEAKRFRKWVTSEVLPALRQEGVYMTPSVQTLTDDIFVSQLREAISKCGSQAAFARRAGMSDAAISRMLNGNESLFTAETRTRIAVISQRIIAQGMGIDAEWVNILVSIEDSELRKQLFSKLKKEGQI